MSGYIRSINSTRITIAGEAFRQDTCIRVRRPWFILPAGLVVCAAIVLQATILISRARCGLVWKSSSLPYLVHPMHNATSMELQGLERLSEMNARAQKTNARFGKTEDDGGL